MTTAAELRKQADALERQEWEDAIKDRCRVGDYEWNRHGRCFREYHEFVKCTDRQHFESWTDEYGSRQVCPVCRGNGRIFTTHRLRVPEYDAPRPPAR